ncbi:hypothetical protein [Paracoccus sp. KR1-242]|uniref:hypothetical protein n=1 Tax=Paracoccus sp. KR1-242 TaxID=3410028 RepID=UPI003C094BB7
MAIGSLVGPALSVVGSLLGSRSADKRDKRNWQRQLITWGHEDEVRRDQRRYDAGRTVNDRKHAAQVRNEERAYQRTRLANDRAYDERRMHEDRAYAREDRANMQALTDRQAERTTASRGIDWQKLRSEAEAAGFNPLTAMSMAGAYSTEVGYGVAGAPYQAAPGNVSGGVGYNGGGSGPVASATTGGGYSSSFVPAMASGSFAQEAFGQLGAVADNYFNTPERDVLADSLRTALNTRAVAEARAVQNPPQSFGYDLQKVKPFIAAKSSSAPQMSKINAPQPAASDDAVTPPKLPLTVAGYPFKPTGAFSDVEAAESRYGDLVSLPYGVLSFGSDVAANLMDAGERKLKRIQGKRVYKIGGKYYAQEDDKPAAPKYDNPGVHPDTTAIDNYYPQLLGGGGSSMITMPEWAYF